MSAISQFLTQTNLKNSLSDGGYSGITSRVEVNANSVGKYAVLYMTSNGYEPANATSDSKTPGNVIALVSGTGSDVLVLKSGFVRNSSWSFTKGGPVYLSTSDGGVTQTKPSSTDNAVQYLGEAYDTDILDFNPDSTVVTVA
jgi:hypothetical protein